MELKRHEFIKKENPFIFEITDGGSWYSTITVDWSHSSHIIGGQNNTLTANNSYIIGSNITATEDDTTYVNNLSVQGEVRINGDVNYDMETDTLRYWSDENNGWVILKENVLN